MIIKQAADNFFKCKSIAVIWASRDKKKFGYVASKDFRDKKYNIKAVSTNVDQLNSNKCSTNMT